MLRKANPLYGNDWIKITKRKQGVEMII